MFAMWKERQMILITKRNGQLVQSFAGLLMSQMVECCGCWWQKWILLTPKWWKGSRGRKLLGLSLQPSTAVDALRRRERADSAITWLGPKIQKVKAEAWSNLYHRPPTDYVSTDKARTSPLVRSVSFLMTAGSMGRLEYGRTKRAWCEELALVCIPAVSYYPKCSSYNHAVKTLFNMQNLAKTHKTPHRSQWPTWPSDLDSHCQANLWTIAFENQKGIRLYWPSGLMMRFEDTPLGTHFAVEISKDRCKVRPGWFLGVPNKVLATFNPNYDWPSQGC